MKSISLDENWTFRWGYLDSIGGLGNPGESVNLPHDAMIGTPVSKDCPAAFDSGYFNGGICNYTKNVFIPAEWKNQIIGLKFDGVMMNASVDVNGSRVAHQNYGYAPFYVDLTQYVTFGEENRITVNVNSGSASNSRWYTGLGIYREVKLCTGPRVYIPEDGIYAYTSEVADNTAFIKTEIEIENRTLENRLVEVTAGLCREGEKYSGEETPSCAKAKTVIFVAANSKETAYLSINLKNPELWDCDNPNLYRLKVCAKSKGEYRTHLEEKDDIPADEKEILFGVRTISADSQRGLLINGKSVKLKGGCLHHDNGLLGAVSLYEVEARKIRKLKETGFNAIRTAHNPPSSALVEACERLGMYIFDEAFDAWGIGKRAGDYNQYFENNWKKDLTAFIKRDRNSPAVIIWSTGNEIPERGGLGDGYRKSTRLAKAIKELDRTRPVSNGICSLWAGLDDKLAENQNLAQNASSGFFENLWERVTEPFTNGLDIVGYNYMEELYERDHELFPERVILGSENYPKEIGYRWPFIESHPYVIGDFTWTAWDYLGEAGIGKAFYVEKDDPTVNKNPWELLPYQTTFYPYRTAEDADYDITGVLLPQGQYRSVVWGSKKTHLYTRHPKDFDKVEMMAAWGFPQFEKNWSYEGYEGKPVKIAVFSQAEEVEVFVNGKSIGRKKVCFEKPMPNLAEFETLYEAGTLEAVSYTNGREVSRDMLCTAGKPAEIKLNCSKKSLMADGHDAAFVMIEVVDEKGQRIPDCKIQLSAKVEGPAALAGFGSGNPVTEELYTDNITETFHGRACAILRSGYAKGPVKLTVTGPGLESSTLNFE
jgi:beta-galactosidase